MSQSIAGELAYEMNSLRYGDLNARMLKVLGTLGREDGLLDTRAVSIADLRRFLEGEQGTWRDLRTGPWRFETTVGPRQHRLDSMRFEGVFDSQTDAIAFLEEFVGIGNFIHARLYDADYDRWQNEVQLDLYTTAGKPTRDLKVTTDTLGWRVVDVSKNPGRRIVREGYIEAVGSVMWFGERFWRAVGRPKPDLRDLGKSTAVSGTVDRLVLHPKPFTTHDGEEGPVQKIAWRTIFSM